MKVLVCGGRTYKNQQHVFHVLDQLHAEGQKITQIIEGEAPGADLLAAKWAASRKVELLPIPADWDNLGLAAGPIRNQQMLDEGEPDLVVAFPGKTGTADMVAKARKAGVKVIEP